jgi:prepilin-type N-terminal cleavage/methylation domain-containing protein
MIMTTTAAAPAQRRQRGFSLIELLIVLVIIGILGGLTVPQFISSRRAANMGSAVQSMRTLTTAEVTYRFTDNRNIYGTLADLRTLQLIDNVLGGDNVNTSEKSGYLFQTTVTAAGADGLPHYIISAIPSNALPIVATGSLRYGSSEVGVIYQDAGNLSTHYTTASSLTSGTSRTIGE